MNMNMNSAYRILEAELQALCDREDIRFPDEFKISGKMTKISGLFTGKRNRYTKESTHTSIKISKKIIENLGIDNAIKTLRHEFAHLYTWVNYGHCEHNDTFKRLCVRFGGHMNEKHAGEIYKSAAASENEFNQKTHKYTCPTCDNVLKRFKRISAKVLKRYVCTECKTPVSNFIHEDI